MATGISKAQVLGLATLAFIERNENVVLLGLSGVGKSHIAVSLGCSATQAGIRTRFITAANLLLILTTAHRQNRLADAFRRFVNPYRLLIIEVPGGRGGVADGTRTRDNRNHNPGLYQLSYSHHRRNWPARQESNL